jgi:hypothetical protein
MYTIKRALPLQKTQKHFIPSSSVGSLVGQPLNEFNYASELMLKLW